jgi:hypothetical protein
MEEAAVLRGDVLNYLKHVVRMSMHKKCTHKQLNKSEGVGVNGAVRCGS